MSASASSIDASSKRWLALLALVFLASAAFLAHSFIKAMSSPNEDGVTAEQPARENAAKAPTRSEPAWSFPQEARVFDDRRAATGVSPSDNKDKTVPKGDDAAIKEVVRHQAEYLRTLIKQNRLPSAYGNLTLEQIDEMEKNNILIE